jgi:hypothetical protein
MKTSRITERAMPFALCALLVCLLGRVAPCSRLDWVSVETARTEGSRLEVFVTLSRLNDSVDERSD